MQSKYPEVAEAIRQDCLARKLPANAFLPSEVELAATLGVNRLTVRRALLQLEAQKIVSPVMGKRRRLLVGHDEAKAVQLIACIARGDAELPQVFSNLVFSRIYEHLAREFQAHNFNLVGVSVDKTTERLPAILHNPLNKAVMVFGGLPERLKLEVGVPVIVLNPSRNMRDFPDGYFVDFDAFGLAARAAERMLAAGYKAPVWVEWESIVHGEFFSVACASFLEAASVRGVKSPKVLAIERGTAVEVTAARLGQFLRKAPETDGLILASSDLSPVVLAALAQLKIAVPKRLAVLALGGQEPVAAGWEVSGYYNDYPAISAVLCEYVRLILSGQMKHIRRIVLHQARWQEGHTFCRKVRQ